MPIYSFRCRKCGRKTVVQHGFREPHPKTCMKPVPIQQPVVLEEHRDTLIDTQPCGGELAREWDSPQIVYKGAGFFSVDKRLDETPDDSD